MVWITDFYEWFLLQACFPTRVPSSSWFVWDFHSFSTQSFTSQEPSWPWAIQGGCSPHHTSHTLFTITHIMPVIGFLIRELELKCTHVNTQTYPLLCAAGLNCVPPKFVCWSSNFPFLRMWPYVEAGWLPMCLVKRGSYNSRVDPWSNITHRRALWNFPEKTVILGPGSWD